jgi:predicted metal-dependent HD superfamily phosphohydrolase
MTDPSYDECLVEAELRARAAYSEPHRSYHDERHLKECLAELDWVTGLTERERRLLKWAILWHDAVYEPGQRNNEEQSAELARFELDRCGVPDADSAEVARLIRATEFHLSDPRDRLGRLIVSIDLAILGSDDDRYAEYVAGVRTEYKHVPEDLWRTGRALVLKRLLDSDPLFPDPDFQRRLEERARHNMEAELKALGEG